MFVMWNSEDKAKGKSKKVKRGMLRSLRAVLLTFCLLTFAFFLPACRRDMQDQPKAIAYRGSSFYKDGNASRQLVEGTVARGYLRDDREFYFGKKVGNAGGSSQTATSATPASTRTAASATNATALYPDDVDTFPFPITKEALERGQERYQIFC